MKSQTTIESKPKPWAPLRHRNYRLYWIGQFVSLIGGWAQQLAAAWVTMQLAPTATALGVVTFVASIPPILLLLHGGVAADKGNKRIILIWTQVLFASLAFVMAYLVGSGKLEYWHILAFAVISGIGMAFEMPANNALAPDLVEREEIPAAVQLNQAIFHGSRVIGPGIAGWLIGQFGAQAAYIANGVSFLPVILTLLVIRPLRVSTPQAHGSILAAMREGLGYIRSQRRVMALIWVGLLTTLLIFPNFAVLMPYYVKNVLKMGAGAVGTTMTVGGSAALLGAMSIMIVPERYRVRHMAVGFAGIVTGLLILWAGPGLGLMQGHSAGFNLTVACVGVAFQSFSVSSTLGIAATIIQQTVPDELRGRVMSVNSLAFMGAMPIGVMALSALADAITMPWEMLISSLLYGVFAFVLLLPKLRN